MKGSIWSTRCLRARRGEGVGVHQLAERTSLSKRITHPGYEPRITRAGGRHHHRVSNAQIRGGESIEPSDLVFVIVTIGRVSVGPSSEALCEAFCQRNIHWACPLGLSVQCPSPAGRSPITQVRDDLEQSAAVG